MSKNQIVRIIALILFCLFLYLIRGVLFPIIVSILLFYVLNPLANLLSNKRPKGLGVNRMISIMVAFFALIAVISGFLLFIVPPIIEEFGVLLNNAPQYISSAQNIYNSLSEWHALAKLPKAIDDVFLSLIHSGFNYLALLAQQSVNVVLGILSRFIYLIIIPIILFFLLQDEKNIASGIVELLPEEHRPITSRIIKKIDEVLRNYIMGELILCLIVGVLTSIVLYFLGVKFFLILGVVAAVSQLIPNVGPFIGAVPALFVALLASPWLMACVLLYFIVLDVVITSILGPKILADKLKLHPLTVVISVLVFGELLGVWGLFFAAPITAVIKILYLEIRNPD